MTPHDPSHISAWRQQLEKIRADFFESGVSIAEWSREHGFRPNAVYRVLSGHSLAMRGSAHKIAVALGVKGNPDKTSVSSSQSGKDTTM